VRAHLAAIGAPILGDALYGGAFGPRHYLHAARLAFAHPVTGAALDIRVEPPSDWPHERADETA
jgi:23S rRNA pseudouridine1911/1915/1917 synthase